MFAGAVCAGVVAAAFSCFAVPASAAQPVNFSRDVLPILSDNCFQCHGPDENKRKGGLRLDTREAAVALKDGVAAIVPGNAKGSEMLARLTASDPEDVMPPAKSNKKVTPEQAETLRRWIQEGAQWGRHWAFEKLTRPEISENQSSKIKAQNPIDAFILNRLAKEKVQPQSEAPRQTLIRRSSFDLTGMPPTPQEVEAFVNDRSPDAWERVVTRLLKSPHYGERMAMWWLDAARYSDTDGYQGDDTRTNWPWRDWVIGAFNRNQRFDEFTIEQFAGDLLPGATPEQKIATCFHRNHMTNGEGGRDPEESRIDYVIDRVNTVGTLWMGLTLGCCQCHSHKFVPISQADYYRMSAFFNSIDEDGKAGRNAKPYLSYQSPLADRAVAEAQKLVDERKTAEAEVKKDAEKPFAEWLVNRLAEVRGGFKAWHPIVGTIESVEGTELRQEKDGVVQASGPNPRHDDYRLIAAVKLPRITGLKLEVFPHASHTAGGLSRGESGEFILTDIKVQVRRPGSTQVRDILVANAVADVSTDQKAARQYGDIKGVLDDDPRNGWTTKGHDAKQAHIGVFAFAEPLVLAAKEELIFEMRHRSTTGDANIGRFRVSATDQPGSAVRAVEAAPLELLAAAKIADPAKIETALRTQLFETFLADFAPYAEPKAALERANRQLGEVKKAAAKVDVMVLAERAKPRETNVLVRGVWDKKGEKVESDVPPALTPWQQGGEKSRLGFARWLVSRDNSLTARVVVNHLWQLFFGSGLVRTPEDFGLQGEPPTHPELLDWLASELVAHDWDLQHVIRLIVTSATYRQSSDADETLRMRDPDNRLLARGARYRLPSWMLRDAALRASGLLNPAIGGPPVRPYQPEGVWEEIFMGRFRYEPTEGAEQYRRTVYAFWRRSAAPTFLFDSAQRRVCEVRTPRTNTPLQALTLLNDATFLEASRVMAGIAMRAATDTPGRLREMTSRVLSRPPRDGEAAVLKHELDRALAHYRAHPEDAKKLLEIGQSRPDATVDVAELAAHTLVASMIFNLDEAISHE